MEKNNFKFPWTTKRKGVKIRTCLICYNFNKTYKNVYFGGQRVFVHWYGVSNCKHGTVLVKGILGFEVSL